MNCDNEHDSLLLSLKWNSFDLVRKMNYAMNNWIIISHATMTNVGGALAEYLVKTIVS